MRKLAPLPEKNDARVETSSEHNKNKSTTQLVAFDKNEIIEKRKQARLAAEQKSQQRTHAKKQQIAEKIANATEELSSGIAEMNTSSQELASTMEQIAQSAEESSTAAQQSLAASEQLSRGAKSMARLAQNSFDKVAFMTDILQRSRQEITELIENIFGSAKKIKVSAEVVLELETQSKDISQIVTMVSETADQTNLLALNAAIEAARAGVHGKGFSIVADEVQSLAETSEKSALAINEQMQLIQNDILKIAKDTEDAGNKAIQETENAKVILDELDRIQEEINLVKQISDSINKLTTEISSAIEQFTKGTVVIASASEEAGAAAHQASSSTVQQKNALQDIEVTTYELAQMAEELKTSTDTDKNSEALAAAAEELSATIQQAYNSSEQISSALKQISKGSEQQASATQESSAAITQIEKSILAVNQLSDEAIKKIEIMAHLINQNIKQVLTLITGVKLSSEQSKKSAEYLKALENRLRGIDKTVDTINVTSIMTNMLAVNGGIEAARSGDFGRGFSVVASDIKTLANDSALNAEKIKELLRVINSQVTQVSNDILDMGLKAETDVDQATKTTQILKTVEGALTEINRYSKEVAVIASESVVSIQQSKKGVEQIASAAQETSAAVHQASTASNQQSHGLQDLSQAIEDISAMADELQLRSS